MLLTARVENNAVDIDNLIRKNVDAIAIMGHISYDLAQLLRDVIHQHSTKSLAHCVLRMYLLPVCSSQTNYEPNWTTLGHLIIQKIQ